MALDVGQMDINTIYGMSIGWEKGQLAGSQYLPWYLHTQYTGERAKGHSQTLMCRQAMSAVIFGSDLIE